MTEVEALLEIASAIELLAAVVGALVTVFWLILLFKDTGGSNSSAIREVAKQIGVLAKLWKE